MTDRNMADASWAFVAINWMLALILVVLVLFVHTAAELAGLL